MYVCIHNCIIIDCNGYDKSVSVAWEVYPRKFLYFSELALVLLLMIFSNKIKLIHVFYLKKKDKKHFCTYLHDETRPTAYENKSDPNVFIES